MLVPAQNSPEYIIPTQERTVMVTGVVELELEVDAAGNLKNMRVVTEEPAYLGLARRPCLISMAQNLFRRSATANRSRAKSPFRFITSHQARRLVSDLLRPQACGPISTTWSASPDFRCAPFSRVRTRVGVLVNQICSYNFAWLADLSLWLRCCRSPPLLLLRAQVLIHDPALPIK